MPGTSRELSDAVTVREVNKAMKDIFKETFVNLGGSAWLTAFVQESPANARVFVQILGKLIPPQPADSKTPGATVIDLPWVRHGRLSYREDLNGQKAEDSEYTER